MVWLDADTDAWAYKAQTHEQSSYFVKLKRGNHHNIGTIIQLLLQNTGMQQVISPFTTKEGQLTHEIDDFTLIVYPFIEGQESLSRNLTHNQWIILGKALKQLHAFRLPTSIKEQIQQESYCPKWRKIVQAIYTQIEAGTPIPDAVSIPVINLYARATIQRLVHRAEQLGQKIQQQSPEFVLCHTDIHGGNVLIANNGAIYIVDWDQPIMAPKKRNLMFIGGGVGNVWNDPNDLHEQDLFYKG